MRQQQRASARASADADTGPPTILVVEDEVLVRFWISDELRRAGFAVLEAANADEALRVLSRPLPVHVVLTDIHMPGKLDGAGLVEWLRHERPETKIIVETAVAHVHKADALLFKPFRSSEMIRAIQRLLGLDGAQSASV
jgi:CheY-like chemotaxis protein